MPLVEARSQLAAKVEVTEGTAIALAAADAVLAGDIVFDPDITMEELNLQSSSLSPFPGVAGSRMARITCRVPLKGSGTAGTPPEFGKLIRACGYGETIVGATSVTYAPASTAIPSLTMAKYVDGKRYLLAGARGNFTLTFPSGRPAFIEFDFLGTSIADSDATLLAGVSYQTSVPQPFQNASFTINTYGAIIEAMVIASANTLALRDDANSAQGFLSAKITDRLATLTLNPEDVILATEDFWATWEGGSLVVLAAQLGQSAGNILTIGAPKAQYGKLGQSERNGITITEIDATLRRNVGDDELSLAFT